MVQAERIGHMPQVAGNLQRSVKSARMECLRQPTWMACPGNLSPLFARNTIYETATFDAAGK